MSTFSHLFCVHISRGTGLGARGKKQHFGSCLTRLCVEEAIWMTYVKGCSIICNTVEPYRADFISAKFASVSWWGEESIWGLVVFVRQPQALSAPSPTTSGLPGQFAMVHFLVVVPLGVLRGGPFFVAFRFVGCFDKFRGWHLVNIAPR